MNTTYLIVLCGQGRFCVFYARTINIGYWILEADLNEALQFIIIPVFKVVKYENSNPFFVSLFEESDYKLPSSNPELSKFVAPIDHPEAEQDVHQIQAPVQVPSVVSPDEITPALPIKQAIASPSIDAFKEGTPVTQEETQGGLPSNATVAKMRDKVKEMMKFAWNGYATYAWGSNELKPIAKMGHLPSVLGSLPMGASLIDGLDTLYIMNLNKEFDGAVEWIENSLDFDKPSTVSVFEFNIRYLGGLLSAYTFTQRPILLKKAVELAQRLLPAFETPSGIPMSLVNLKT
ncbi:unnamed protein product [Heterobilharzia americana]|nr:unnamed protein product [Heterobilharzia americana]